MYNNVQQVSLKACGIISAESGNFFQALLQYEFSERLIVDPLFYITLQTECARDCKAVLRNSQSFYSDTSTNVRYGQTAASTTEPPHALPLCMCHQRQCLHLCIPVIGLHGTGTSASALAVTMRSRRHVVDKIAPRRASITAVLELQRIEDVASVTQVLLQPRLIVTNEGTSGGRVLFRAKIDRYNRAKTLRFRSMHKNRLVDWQIRNRWEPHSAS